MDWVDELKASLLRAGDHIAPDIPTLTQPVEGGTRVYFKLFHQLPDKSRASVSSYIRLFAEEQGHKISKVTHKKFLIQFLVDENP